MQEKKALTCCFSGYRAEKMPFPADDTAQTAQLQQKIRQAVSEAAAVGYRRFFTGMSTGFDLWAADVVLDLQKSLPLKLICAIPFEQQAAHFSPTWKKLFNRVLLSADQVFVLSPHYQAGCYAARNRFMVDASSRLIAYYDGQAGGTAQTLRYAMQHGLSIVNLANVQLSLSDAT